MHSLTNEKALKNISLWGEGKHNQPTQWTAGCRNGNLSTELSCSYNMCSQHSTPTCLTLTHR